MFLMRSNIFEVVRPAIFLGQEGLAIVKFARSAARTLRGIGAIEVGGVTVSNITEPGLERAISIDDLYTRRKDVSHTSEP